MKYMLVLVMAVLLVLGVTQVFAGVIFSDDFESYNLWNLDSNEQGDFRPNGCSNGDKTGNPWWGPLPSNADIVTQEYTVDDRFPDGVTPHSGSQMVAGWYGGGTNYLNMAYRLNNNQRLTANFAADWWFFDGIGTASDFNAVNAYWADSVSIVNYTANSIILDYPKAALSQNFADGDFAQRLSLGASNDISTGFDATKYQARIKGATGLTDQYGDGWVNLNLTRSVGWHHGRIMVGASNGNGGNTVSFFIDDMQNALLTATASAPSGYNLFELQEDTKVGGNWGYWPYYDDVSISTIPEPGSILALGAGLFSLLGFRKRRK